MTIFGKHGGITGGGRGGSLGLIVAVDLEVVDFCAGLQRAATGETILDVADAAVMITTRKRALCGEARVRLAGGRVLNKADPFFADEIGAKLVCEVRKERVYITLFEGVRHAILIFEPYFCSDLTRLGDQLKSTVGSHINGTTKHFKN
jgi:hypothetical protein